jgi:hypothetical protein
MVFLILGWSMKTVRNRFKGDSNSKNMLFGYCLIQARPAFDIVSYDNC